MKIELGIPESSDYSTKQLIDELEIDIGGLIADARRIRVVVQHKMEIVTHLRRLLAHEEKGATEK